ncbi:MAG: tRNA CCA-pyrophosphorylase [Anaerolineae bacterium]|nr:tRNA CCA-pyrophosphorylase [Anaerolineae bacterium]
MNQDHELYKAGLLLHGHKCPAMPMGLRAGLAAIEQLGVERAKDGQLMAFIEIGQDHCATCYADGIQMATGCTFGKGNIQKLGYGKFALTLVERKTGRSTRVVTKPETIQRNKESEFIQYRQNGKPASQIEPALVEPLVDFVLSAPAEQMFDIGDVKPFQLPAGKSHDFNAIICEVCGEVTVESYARIKNGQIVCMPCAEAV